MLNLSLGVMLALNTSLAGDIFFTDLDSYGYYEFDTRARGLALLSHVHDQSMVYSGMAFDSVNQDLWLFWPGYLENFIINTNMRSYSYYQQTGGFALAFNPDTNQVLALGPVNGTGIWDVETGVMLSDPGIPFTGADWFDDGGFIVAPDVITGNFYGLLPGAPPTLLAYAPAGPTPPLSQVGLAYDKDLRLFWMFTAGRGGVWLLEPETFSVVGHLFTDMLIDGAAGSIDDVPAQTPELLVTGVCPGQVYVTVADATPGGHVLIGSATSAGARTLRNGACAGTQLGLQNPTPRFDLVANSYGIASTRVTTTPNMCGRPVVFQGLDVATCTPTAVESVVTWLP